MDNSETLFPSNHSYRNLLINNYTTIILFLYLMMETEINAHLLIFHIADIIHYYCSKLGTYVKLYFRRVCKILEDIEIDYFNRIIDKIFQNLNVAGAAGQGAAEPGAAGETGTLRVEEYDSALTLARDGLNYLDNEYGGANYLQRENINQIKEMLTNFTNKLTIYQQQLLKK